MRGPNARLHTQLGGDGGEVVPASVRSWVTLEKQTCYGCTLEEALAWCLVWLMPPELGIGPFRV